MLTMRTLQINREALSEPDLLLANLCLFGRETQLLRSIIKQRHRVRIGDEELPMTGEVAAVRAAVEAGAAVIGKKGLLVNRVVIPSPSPELYREVL